LPRVLSNPYNRQSPIETSNFQRRCVSLRAGENARVSIVRVPTRSSWRAFKNPGSNGSVSHRKNPESDCKRQTISDETARKGENRQQESRARDGGGEGGNRARSPRYFVQITHAAVICEIPVILHFKLENKTARPEAAVLIRLAGSRCYRPQSRLPCRKQAEHECSENYSSPVRGVSIIFPFPLFPFPFPFFPLSPRSIRPPYVSRAFPPPPSALPRPRPHLSPTQSRHQRVRSCVLLGKRRSHVDTKPARHARGRARANFSRATAPLRIPALPTRGVVSCREVSCPRKREMLASSDGQSSNYQCSVSVGGVVGVSLARKG